ncbi:unannotated protein [freshwater metagenome]|uniref:Unannotated protein n=1 Tax=freshwater metagenome TaxID=449393 RepID=A0A6J7LL84_9ZZZZ
MLATIRAEWGEVADQVGLTKVERDWMWGRQILSPSDAYPCAARFPRLGPA